MCYPGTASSQVAAPKTGSRLAFRCAHNGKRDKTSQNAPARTAKHTPVFERDHGVPTCTARAPAAPKARQQRQCFLARSCRAKYGNANCQRTTTARSCRASSLRIATRFPRGQSQSPFALPNINPWNHQSTTETEGRSTRLQKQKRLENRRC